MNSLCVISLLEEEVDMLTSFLPILVPPPLLLAFVLPQFPREGRRRSACLPGGRVNSQRPSSAVSQRQVLALILVSYPILTKSFIFFEPQFHPQQSSYDNILDSCLELWKHSISWPHCAKVWEVKMIISVINKLFLPPLSTTKISSFEVGKCPSLRRSQPVSLKIQHLHDEFGWRQDQAVLYRDSR